MSQQPAALPKDEVMVVKLPHVNVRSAPGRTGRVRGTLAKGKEVKIVRRTDGWAEVESDAVKGWISLKVLEAR
jgi:uncharacterized protein YgiM (DUF1202 family)